MFMTLLGRGKSPFCQTVVVNVRYINCCILQPKILTNIGSLTKLEYLGDSLEAKFHQTDSQVSLIMKIFNSSKTVFREKKNEDQRHSFTCSESQLSQQLLEGDRIFLGLLRHDPGARGARHSQTPEIIPEQWLQSHNKENL